jgi:hypothetical protein
MADALTTKTRVKDRLQLTGVTFDDLIDRLIVATTKRISQMCNRRFLQATYTNELYDGSDLHGSRRAMLILKNAPVHTITSVQYKTGLNSNPTWEDYDEDDYDVDMDLGILYMDGVLPTGKRNIRVTYNAGYSGNSIGITDGWVFNSTPTGTVNGVNLIFTLAADADEVIVYADGLRVQSSNVTHTEGTDEFTLAAGQAPFSTISADYLPTTTSSSEDDTLPEDLVEVCEEVVARLFKRRDSEGRSSETFQESSISWRVDVFTRENLATIRNYRRGNYL